MSRSRKRPAGSQERAVGYLRVSSDDQHLGPEAQRSALTAWCAARKIQLIEVHEDLGVSGGAELERRPGLMAALDALATHGAGVLVIARRDRLARDVMLAAMVERLVERAGARVLSADGAGNSEGADGMLMRGVVDLFAAYERLLIRSRTKAALAVLKGKGHRVGAVPYGCQLAADGVRLEAAPSEQAVIQRIRRWRRAGLSISGITQRLNEEAYPARGSRWHATTVSRLLRRTTME